MAAGGLCGNASGGCSGPHPLLGTIIFIFGAAFILAAFCVAVLNVVLFLTAKLRRRRSPD
jgi:hypothetical protein